MINKLRSIIVKPKVDFSNLVVNPTCSELEVNKWILSDFVVKKLIPVVGTRPFPLDELMLMVTAVAYVKPEYIFEWGTHYGKSARIFYESVKAMKIPCRVHSIDLPEDAEHVEHPGYKHGMLVKGLKGVSLHRGDGVSKAIEIYKTVKGKRVLFFVDGDHSYESVTRELSAILSEASNPAILLHDTFYQSEGSKYNIGPYNAINDVLKGKEDKYKVMHTQAGLPGMTLIYQK